MHEPGASVQHTDRTAQHGRWYPFVAEFCIPVATLLGVITLEHSLVEPLLMQHQSPQRQLAFGGATYALAIVGSLLLPWQVLRLRAGLLRRFLGLLVIGIVMVPSGSATPYIAHALNQLGGWGMDAGGVGWLAFLFWVSLYVVILLAYVCLGFVVWFVARRGRPLARR
jgi:hypothetical protein